jgi:predicted nucleic acid-binding protein
VKIFVVDASVGAKWLFEENHSADSLRLLNEDHLLHAPDIFLLELDSLLTKRIRRGEINAREGRTFRAAWRRFPVHLHPFSPLLDPAFEIAARTGCSLYDCLYVSLASLLGGVWVTADRRLYDGMAAGPFAPHLLWVSDIP